MANIRIHVFHTGEVCVSPNLPFGGDHCNPIKASGVFESADTRLWLPVSAYLIEHPKGRFLVDTGWARDMSPKGEFDKKAQIKSLGSWVLYKVNQGRIPMGECIDEQLAKLGLKDSDLDAVLITHLDCDHANGLKQVKGAKKFLVASDEVKFAKKHPERYYKGWWKDILLSPFDWNDTLGPAGKSCDLVGDGSIELINIPGHADGLFAVKVKNDEGNLSCFSRTAAMPARAGSSGSPPASRRIKKRRRNPWPGSENRASTLTASSLLPTTTRRSSPM